jgi:nucleoside-diphosphate-sugar epimerase
MKKIIVIGGAGFIGSHTVDLLLEKNYKVIVYDNFSSGKLPNLNLFHSNLEVVQGDILDYPKLLKEIGRADAVLHLAALSSVPKSIDDPVESLKINSLGFINVLQALREIAKPIRLVYASSASVYGNAISLPCRDDIPLISQALSPYALQKGENERYADLYLRLFGIQNLGLRYFNVYGPRQDPKSPYSGVIAKFIEQYQKQDAIKIFGDGEQSRDFIHVNDVARANVLALESDCVGVVNIATGVAETLKNLVNYIEQVGNRKADVEMTAERPGDIPRSYADTASAKTKLHFQYEVPLAEGVKSLINY